MYIFITIFRGLFEKDKLVFSFMLCVDIMKTAGRIRPEEWNYFLRGVAGMDKVCNCMLDFVSSSYCFNYLS